MRKIISIIFILSFIPVFLAGIFLQDVPGSTGVPGKMGLEEVIKELHGTWEGRGSSEEVRFRNPRLTLIVKHETQFFFYVDEKGNISGEGTVEFDMDQDTTGLDDLAAQIRGMLGLLPSAVPSSGMPGTHQQAVKDKISGLSKIQYKAPHLKYGKEIRHFKFKGRVGTGTTTAKEQSKDRQDWDWPDDPIPTDQKVIYLEPVINFTKPDGTPSSTLIAEWEVNGKKEESTFPCWSPFLKKPGILRRGPGGAWLVEFLEQGKNREGKSVWQEYGYVWMSRLTQKNN